MINPSLLYDALATEFRVLHRAMAPGKDPPIGYWDPLDANHVRERWNAFRSMCGPIDVACILQRYEWASEVPW